MKYALLGRSIAYSLSPRLHAAIMESAGIRGEYGLLDVPENELAGALARLRRGEYAGFNVTIPYKRVIRPLLDAVTQDAARADAVNTVYERNGLLIGDNTDVYALSWQLGGMSRLPRGPVSVLGTGGAARAAVTALSRPGISPVHMISRYPERRAPFGGAKVLGYGALNEGRYRLMINATPHGAEIAWDSIRFAPDFGLDMCYAPRVTPMQRAMARLGAPCENGIPMLVMQALRAQERFQAREIISDALARRLTELFGGKAETA